MATETRSKDEINRDFGKLLKEYEKQASHIETREEIAEKQREKEVVQSASAYTVPTIVKGLADLQLDFGKLIDEIADQLEGESSKLVDLRKAIGVAAEQLQQLRNIRLAADALDILKKENADRMKAFEEEAAEERESLEEEIEETRADWAREQAEHEQAVEEYNERLAKDRARAEEQYEYELKRERQQEQDEFDEEERRLRREIAEKEEAKQRDWAEREAALDARQEQHEENVAAIENFPEKLDEETKEARQEAIRETMKEAENRAKLMEAEVEGLRKVHDLKKQTLDATIEKQDAEITRLEERLQGALDQVKESVNRAIDVSRKAVS